MNKKADDREMMTVAECAAILGITPQAVRVRIQRGIYKEFAACVKYPQRTIYDIYRTKFNKFLGKENT